MTYSLSHLSDSVLERDMTTLDRHHRSSTAALLAHLAEFDARRLYLPAGYPSLFAYCVQHLHWCEQAAFKRIRAARTARRFPSIYPALADGRLHLSAVVLLSPCLTVENTDQLLGAATHKSKSEIEQLIAEWFPQLDVPPMVQVVSAPARAPAIEQLSPGTVGRPASSGPDAVGESGSGTEQPAERPVELPAPRRMETFDRGSKVAPLAPQRFALQLTMGKDLHDKLHHAQELLSHQIPSGDLAELLERALDALISQLERRKFAAAKKPRQPKQPTAAPGRYVPAHVRRAVWKRDGGRCTFVGESGYRCRERRFLEFDHIDEFARGGQATVERMRLRCRAHNQYTAERTFGVEFMRRKREGAR